MWASGKLVMPLQTAMEKQAEFVAAAEHELKTPLSVLTTSLAMLRREGVESKYHVHALFLNCGLNLGNHYTYYGNSFTLPPLGKIRVPTAIAAFPHDVLPVPREWIERNYPVIMYTEMSRGGHFTALEQPKAFAENLSSFMKMVF